MTRYHCAVDIDVVDPTDAEFERVIAGLAFLAIPHWISKVTSLEIEIGAPSGAEALERCIQGLVEAGLPPRHFDLGLVSVSDIAEMLGVSRETVRLWATGERRAGFPQRFAQVGSSQVWAWSDIHEWARGSGYLAETGAVPLPVRLLERANGSLAERLVGIS